jgi:sugar-phosphatase
MKYGIVFDLDGVLIESELFFLKAEVSILTRHGIPLTVPIAAEYLGLKMHDYFTCLEKRFSISLDHSVAEKELTTEIERIYTHEVPLTEGVRETLEILSKEYVLGLATSREKSLAMGVMARLGIESYFPFGIYKEDASKGKPDPEPYLRACEKINLDPKFCFAVEDAEKGFVSARAAGLTVCARKAIHNSAQDFTTADIVFSDMPELPTLIKNCEERV